MAISTLSSEQQQLECMYFAAEKMALNLKFDHENSR